VTKPKLKKSVLNSENQKLKKKKIRPKAQKGRSLVLRVAPLCAGWLFESRKAHSAFQYL
jgi:hypothetical protein